MADSRIQFALIDICARDSIDGCLATRTLVWICFRRTKLAGAPPGLANRVAAFGAKHDLPLDVILALIIPDLEPALASPVVYAHVSRCVQRRARRTLAAVTSRRVDTCAAHADVLAGAEAFVHIFAYAGVRVVPVPGRARTLVAARSISAQAVLAQHQVHLALVDVFADLPCAVDLISWVAYTTVASYEVLARPVGADVRIHPALINIFTVDSGSSSVGAKTRVFGCAGQRAGRALATPGRRTLLGMGAAAAGRLPHLHRRRTTTFAIPVPRVAVVEIGRAHV